VNTAHQDATCEPMFVAEKRYAAWQEMTLRLMSNGTAIKVAGHLSM